MVDNVTLSQLKFIESRIEVTVPDFGAEFQAGRFARGILQNLVDAGLVKRAWRRNRGFYSLTEEGQEKIVELTEQAKQARNESKNAKPNASK